MRKLLFLMLWFCMVTPIYAVSNAERWYQFEMIVFSDITSQGLHSEQWPWIPSHYAFPTKMMTLSTSQQDSVWTVLPHSYFVLSPEERQLLKQKNYHVLLHWAWRQKIADRRHARPIHIFGGNLYTDSGEIIETNRYGQQPYANTGVWQVNGTITPSLFRYIDVKLDLLFSQPTASLPTTSQLNNIQGYFAYFRLQQRRRMRSRQLNYIGHPLYGVLIKVIPIHEK